MIDSLTSRLKKEGKLADQKAGIVQIEDLIKEAIVDLDEAKKTLRISADRATYVMLMGPFSAEPLPDMAPYETDP